MRAALIPVSCDGVARFDRIRVARPARDRVRVRVSCDRVVPLSPLNGLDFTETRERDFVAYVIRYWRALVVL